MVITLPSVVSVKLASPKTRQCLGGHGHHRGPLTDTVEVRDHFLCREENMFVLLK